ncbi:peptide chain release factor N(5)-glutamine methyltransferase [Candidatus Falkowbacteria bacterium]|nr:peptide chain release factor N(5)-glutamine methyltransferase [Candidatus Falkowbacteria bacterium]
MNINQALAKSKKKLKAKKIDNVDLEAGLLLAHCLKKPREFLFTHPEKELSLPESMKFIVALARRISGVPLAYLVGRKEFYGLDLLVNKNVLIPRPETELMVNEALKIAANFEKVNFIDIGTGSGCITVALGKNWEKSDLYALDISPKALETAKKNAKKHKLSARIEFIRSNLLREMMKKKFNEPAIILANLPYLTPKQVKDSKTIKKEPQLALLGGDDGLDYYHLLFKQIRVSKISNPLFLLCEIDESQPEKIKRLIEDELPSADYEIKKDLSGSYRLAVIMIPGKKRPPIKL